VGTSQDECRINEPNERKMTQDDIIRMAVQCQLINAGNRDGLYMDAIAEFANLVAAAEREVCAQICGEVGEHPSLTPRHCAEAIRARGQV